jgi:hypothetical protein
MCRRLIVSLLAALVCFITAGPAVCAEAVYPPGQRVGLVPPPGMTLSRHFPGFEDSERKAIISVFDFPAQAYDQLETTLFGPSPGVKGLIVDTRESFPFDNGIGYLMTAHIEANGVTLHRWYFLTKAIAGPVGDLTALVNVEVPDAALTVYSDAVIRAALTTVAFREPPIAEQLAMVPFKLNDLAGFRIMKVLSAGGVILTEGPTDDITRQPYVIVSVGPGAPDQASDRGDFANRLLSSAPLRDLTITSAEPMRISNLSGYEIRAKAVDLRGDPIVLVQWVRFGNTGFMRIVGISSQNDWDRMFPRFRAIRDGLEPR